MCLSMKYYYLDLDKPPLKESKKKLLLILDTQTKPRVYIDAVLGVSVKNETSPNVDPTLSVAR